MILCLFIFLGTLRSQILKKQIHFNYSECPFNFVYTQSILTYTIIFLTQIIPEEFVKRFKGKMSGEINLETKNRCIYMIRVAKHQEKLVLTVGWGKFVQTFGLQLGDTIVFRYNGNSKFSVIIFDKLGCENALSVVVDPVQEGHTNATETMNRSNIHPQLCQMQTSVESMNTSRVLPQPMEIQPSASRVNVMPMESLPAERKRRLQMDKSCQANISTINISSSESSGLGLRL
jgi:hypothetical protein